MSSKRKIKLSVNSVSLLSAGTLDGALMLDLLDVPMHKEDLYIYYRGLGLAPNYVDGVMDKLMSSGLIHETLLGFERTLKSEISKSNIDARIVKAFRPCVELWDSHLKRVVGLGVSESWKMDGARESKALKGILKRLSLYTEDIEGAFDAMLKSYDTWPKNLQTPSLSRMEYNIQNIFAHLHKETSVSNEKLVSMIKTMDDVLSRI